MSVAEPRTPEIAPSVAPAVRGAGRTRLDRPRPAVVAWALPIYLLLLAVASAAWASRGIGQSLWRDEAATATAATRTLPQLVHLLSRQDPALAAYYVFMHAWTGVFGASEVSLRFPSLIAVAASIVLIGLLARRLAGTVAGVAAATLLALTPDLLGTYAIQARPYGLVVALVTASALCAVESSRGRRGAWLIALWSVLAAAAIAFEVLSAPAVVAQLVWLLTGRRDEGRRDEGRRDEGRSRIRSLAPAFGLPVVAALGGLAMAHRGSSLQNWIPATSLNQVRGSAVGLVTIGGLVLIVGAIPGLILLARQWREGRQAAGSGARPASQAAFDLVAAALWAVLPFLALVVYSFVVAPSFIPRYYLTATPGASLVVALVVSAAVRGIRARSGRPLARFALTAIVVASLVALTLPFARHQLHVVHNEDLRGAAAFIMRHEEPGDGIVYSPTYAESGLRWYFDDGRDTSGSPRDLQAAPGETAIGAGSLWTPTEPVGTPLRSEFTGVDRVWVAGYTHYQSWTPVPDVGTPAARAVEKCWVPGVTDDGAFDVQLWTRPTGPAKPGCDF